MATNMDPQVLLRVFRAVGGPVSNRNVEKALIIIKNKGILPALIYPEEKRTWYRIKSKLKEHNLL